MAGALGAALTLAGFAGYAAHAAPTSIGAAHTAPAQHSHSHSHGHGHEAADPRGGPWQPPDLSSLRGAWPKGTPGGTWTRPASGYTVSAGYGISGSWAAGRHTGIDLAVPVGTPVYSVGRGTVVFAGWSGSYGYAVTIRMADGKYTLFAHLSEIHVVRGEKVDGGTLIGRSGNTGNSTGPHLHFEVRETRDYGSDVNPVSYLAGHGVNLL